MILCCIKVEYLKYYKYLDCYNNVKDNEVC